MFNHEDENISKAQEISSQLTRLKRAEKINRDMQRPTGSAYLILAMSEDYDQLLEKAQEQASKDCEDAYRSLKAALLP